MAASPINKQYQAPLNRFMILPPFLIG